MNDLLHETTAALILWLRVQLLLWMWVVAVDYVACP